MRLFKCVAAFVMVTLVSSPVFAHTNSIGYVGDGNGGLTFWYGSWHDNTQFNEAEIKIEGANGTTFTAQIDEFDLLSQDSPAGLISGVNFFTSDGTQLIDYDPDDPNGGGESYTWQGINYANLQPGDYTFTYIPLGDTESSYPTGTPTQEWAPMDQVIRTLTITLTQNDLDGDANNNGILDINEVAVGSASGGPTVTGQGSSNVVAYAASSTALVQTITRTQTTSTWDIYSDGSLGTSTSTTTTLDPLVGRVDQIKTINSMMQLSNRGVDFDGIKLVKNNNNALNGMTGDITGIVMGGTKTLESGWGFGAGFGKLDGSAENTSGKVTVDSMMFNIHAEKYIASGTMRLSLTTTSMDYEVDRVIGDFSNKGITEGSDKYARVQWTGDGEKLRPIVGYTRGVTDVDGYVETGSIQSARAVGDAEDKYRYASVGMEFNLTKSISGGIIRDTDGTNRFNLGVNKQISNKTLVLEYGHASTDPVSTNTISAKLNVAF